MRASRLVAAGAALLVAAGCGRGQPPPAGSPDGASPARIVSLVPGATTLVRAVGEASRLVGRTDADTDAALAHLPSVGKLLAPDLERLGALRPDLLIAWSRSDTAALRRVLPEGSELVTTEVERLGDVIPTLRLLAGALGPAARTRAEALARRWDEEMEALASGPLGGATGAPIDGEDGGDRTRLRVLWVVWADPLTVAGPTSHVGDLLRLAGGENVLEPGTGAWPTLSWEAAVTLEPQVVIWGDQSGVPDPRERPGPWRTIEAVREGRVVVVDADSAHVPGLHTPTVAARLGRRLAAHRRSVNRP